MLTVPAKPMQGGLLLVFDGSESFWLVLGLVSTITLVVLNGLFVAIEFALVAVRKTRVEEMVNLGFKGARNVRHAIDRLDRSLAATQLGITFMSIALGGVGQVALARSLQPLLSFLPDLWGPVAANS